VQVIIPGVLRVTVAKLDGDEANCLVQASYVKSTVLLCSYGKIIQMKRADCFSITTITRKLAQFLAIFAARPIYCHIGRVCVQTYLVQLI